MDILGALATAAVAAATALVKTVPAVAKAVRTVVNTIVEPVVNWWNENVAAPSPQPSDDAGGGDVSAAPAQSEAIHAAVPEPEYVRDVRETFTGDEAVARQQADNLLAEDVSSASHTHLSHSDGQIQDPDLEILADFSAEVAASLALAIIHEPAILIAALRTAPTVARALDGMFASSYLIEEGTDALLQWLEYDFGPALRRKLEASMAAKAEEAAAWNAKHDTPAFGGWYSKVGYGNLRMMRPDLDNMLQDEPGNENKYSSFA